MNEAELRKVLGKAKVDEIKKLVRKAKAEGKNPDQIKRLILKSIKEHLILSSNPIGGIQMFMPPPRR